MSFWQIGFPVQAILFVEMTFLFQGYDVRRKFLHRVYYENKRS